jgi:hypothetical protein
VLSAHRNNRHDYRLVISSVLLSGLAIALSGTIGCRRLDHSKEPAAVWSIELSLNNANCRNSLGGAEAVPTVRFVNQFQLLYASYGNREIQTDGCTVLGKYSVIEISVGNGAIGRKLEYVALEKDYTALPVADGGFVVLAGERLTKFDSNFNRQGELDTSRVQGPRVFDRSQIDVSPSGKTILLYRHAVGDRSSQWEWLDSSDLAVIQSLRAGTSTELSLRAADRQVIRNAGFAEDIVDPSGERTLCTKCIAYFADNDWWFIDRSKTYSISTSKGSDKFGGKLDIDALHFARAALAHRIAFVTGHYVGSGFPLQEHFDKIDGRVVVLDWSSNKEVASIPWTEAVDSHSEGLTRMALALSPDGKLLAVMRHSQLTLYAIP